MPESDESKLVQERVNIALADTNIPSVYANGFVNATSAGDILIILELNGRSVLKLNVSYTVAKSLGIALLRTVSSFEEIVGRSMLTTSEIEEAMKANDSKVKS